MRKSKNRMYRWIAAVLTAALLVGQCQVSVLAKEESALVETGVSAENKADAQEDGAGVTDKEAPKESDTDNGGAGDGAGDGTDGAGGGAENSGTDGAGSGAGDGGVGEGGSGAENGGTGEGGSGAENGGTGEGGSGTDNGGTDSAGGGNGTGNGGTGESGSDADNVGMDGEGDDANNGGADDAGENVPGAGDAGTGDEDEDQSGEDGALNKCVCETACTEDAVNVDCPVCAVDYSACAKNAGGGVKPSEGIVEEGTVSENDLDGEDGIALLAADGVEALAIGDEIIYGGIKYTVIGETEVEVLSQGINAVSGDIAIPESFAVNGITYSVTSMQTYAFWRCSNLQSVVIPKTVTIISSHAFDQCSDLTSVEISGKVTIIGAYAFQDCSSLTNIEIPSSVTDIGDQAFQGCCSLASLKIPKGVQRIREKTFTNCSGLISVEIPESVTSIERFAFWGCSSLTSVEIPESVTSIERWAFYGCSSLTSVTIPESVTSIEASAFGDCSGLTSVTIPKNVTSIMEWAFMRCTGLTSIEIPGGVTTIGYHTFDGCSGLTRVTISENISKIDRQAFINCEKLKEMRIVVSSDSKFRLPEVGENAFEGLMGKRYILFVDENGKELTGAALDNAKFAFAEAARNDNDSDDDKWYGWSLKEPGDVQGTYIVTINVKKDGEPWNTECDRKFALKKESDATFTTALDAVEPGTYTIYDVTGLTADEFQSKGVNTGVTVPVVNADATATVDYYTATFYDLDADGNEVEYRDSTDQRPQTVLKTAGRVTKPVTDPEKAGHTFEKWVTAPGGDDEFSFALAEITEPTKIYAKWKVNTAPTYTVTINVKKDGNPWSGHGRTFALLGGGGSGFLEATGQAGDSTYSISQVPDGTYRIYDITGVPADSLHSRAGDTGAEVRVSGADTGVDVTVNGADADRDVHYYTVTFYDLDADGKEAAYGDDTDQRPQIILGGKGVANPGAPVPKDPQKADWQFAGWKTTKDGDTAYDFDTPVTDVTSIFASWVEKTAEQLQIKATATEGGTIDPTGDIAVTKGGEQSFTITPNEGYKIQAVTVDSDDVTVELKETLVRAQTGARYYTFSNVTRDHTIHAVFEADSSDKPGGVEDKPGGVEDKPGGGEDKPGGVEDKPGGGEGKPGGGEDKPGEGDNKPGGVEDKPGEGDNKPGGGEDKPNGDGDKKDDGSDNGGGNGSSGGGNGTPYNTSTGDGAGIAQVTVVSQTSVIQTSGGQDGSAGNQGASTAGKAANGSEPKTNDITYVEVYATLAMIAGLTYLLLYFMEEGRGMTEREKEVFVAAFIRWAKKGGRFRRCCAVAAIFCLLVYYHSIGKRVGKNCFDRECLRQAL